MSRAGRARPRSSGAVVLACLVLGLVAILLGPTPTARAAAGFVTGTVFRDFDGNGIRDAGNPATGEQTDLPMADIHVVAYDAHDNRVGDDTTGADGTYSIDTSSVVDGTPLRIEFDDAQRPGNANALPGDYQSSFHGAGNGTSVRFTTAGSSNVDFGVLEPEDFGDGNAPIITGIQYAGDRNSSGGPLATVVANPWVVPANDPANGNFPLRTTLATYSQTGAVWGMALDRSQNAAYAAASYKRISDLGPLGPGGIYRVPSVLDATGQIGSPGAVQDWLDVGSIGVDVGTVQTTLERGLGNPDAPTRDPDAYQQAGKVGIGGITVSEDGNTLFFVNLFDKDLYALDISGGNAPTSATRIPLHLGANQRPWAVAVHRDTVYVGYVDTGESDGPGVSASAANLQFHVVSTSVASARAGAPDWVDRLTGSLGYAKGDNITGWPCGAGGCPPQTRRWNTWTDQWTWTGANAGSVGFPGYSPTQMYPQAIVGSLAFDDAGRMVVGLIDRASIQGGNRQLGTNPTDSQFYETVSSGDTLIAAPSAGGFQLEDNGSVDGQAGAHVGNDQGPGGGEYFDDSQGASSQGPNHFENTEGGVVTYPGVAQAASTAMDPLNAIRVTGLEWFSLDNGSKARGYNHTQDPLAAAGVGAPGSPRADTAGGPFFQKGGGIGAVALLTRQPPVEIGNRVWLDADFNGRQDPDEPAIEGAHVDLFAADADGNPTGGRLATTDTDAAGEYYFRSDDPAIDGFEPGGRYVVVFRKASGPVTLHGPNADNPGFAGLTWADLSFTKQRASRTEINNDSNPDPGNGRAPVTVGDPGHNDHTIDAGFNASGTFAIEKLIDESGGQPIDGQKFTFDVTKATDFRGDDVLDTIKQTPITVEAGQTAPTAADRQQLPLGTTITIAERDPGQYESVTYDPSATQVITANSGQTTTFRVTDKLYPPGAFTVEKLLDGDEAAVAAAGDATFTVKWTADDAQSGTIEVKAGQVSAPVELPRGTVVQLTEVTPTDLPDGVVWQGYTWQPTDGVTISDDGKTATFTVTSDQTVGLQLTNTVTDAPGSFTVEKLLAGDAAAIEAARGVSFDVAWTAGNGQTGTLTVRGGETSDPVELPAGTVVDLVEARPTDLPAGVNWDSYVWSPAAGVTVSDDGKTASFTVQPAGAVALELTNTLTSPTPSPNPTPPNLPDTGSTVSLSLIVGAALLLAGGAALLIIAHRRRRIDH